MQEIPFHINVFSLFGFHGCFGSGQTDPITHLYIQCNLLYVTLTLTGFHGNGLVLTPQSDSSLLW